MSGFVLRAMVWFKIGYPIAKAVAGMVADGVVTHDEARLVAAEAIDSAWPKDASGAYVAMKVAFWRK
jgi:hypothetical protein